MLNKKRQFSFKSNRCIFFENSSNNTNNEANDLIKQLEKKDSPQPKLDDLILTKQETADIKAERTSTKKLAAESEQAKADFKRIKDTLLLDGKIQDQQKLNDFISKTNIDKLDSPTMIRAAIESLKKLPAQIENDRKNDKEIAKEDLKELTPDAPERSEFKKEMTDILDKNMHLVSNPRSYQNWIDQESNKKDANLGKFKKLKLDFEGINSKDENGLYPRRQVYKQLEGKFEKYELGGPEKSKLINNLNKENREKFLYNIASLESHFKNVNDTLYDNKNIKKMMQGALLTNNLSEQNQILSKSKTLQREEAKAYTYLDAKMTVGGVTTRKISQKGRAQFIDFYKTQDLNQRLNNIKMWEGFIEGEADLAKALLNVFTNKEGKVDKKGFKKAMGSFEEMNFMEKESSIKYYQKLIDKKESDEKLHYDLTEKAAIIKVGEARRKKIISEKTAKRYEEWFKKPENFKDPETKKIGSLKALEKQYETLIQKTPHNKPNEKNLAAFEEQQKKFEGALKKLRQINPGIEDKEIDQWRERYDKEGWKERETIHKELLTEQEDQKKLGLMQKTIESNASDKNKDKLTNKEGSPESLKELQSLILELANNEQGLEANIQLITFLQEAKRNGEYEKYKDNATIKFLWGVIQSSINSFGMGDLTNEQNEIIENKVEDLAQSDDTIKEDLLENYLEQRNLEGIQQSVDGHNKVEKAEVRAQKESEEEVAAVSTEAKMPAEFYKKTYDDTILKEGQGAQVTKIELEESSTSEEIEELRQKMIEDQTKIDSTKEGLSDVKFTIKGETVTTDQAESKMDESGEALDKDLANLAQERLSASLTGKEKDFVNSTQGRAAAIRASKRLREEKVKTEKLRR